MTYSQIAEARAGPSGPRLGSATQRLDLRANAAANWLRDFEHDQCEKRFRRRNARRPCLRAGAHRG